MVWWSAREGYELLDSNLEYMIVNEPVDVELVELVKCLCVAKFVRDRLFIVDGHEMRGSKNPIDGNNLDLWL